MKKFLLKRILARLTKRLAPDIIPLSGQERLRNRDYFSIVLGGDRHPFDILVSALDGNTIKGRQLVDGAYRMPVEIAIDEVKDAPFELRFYLRAHEFFSTKPVKFELLYSLGYFHLVVRLEYLFQWAFNKRTLALRARHDLLKVMIDRTIDDPDARFSPVTLVAELNKTRAVSHPHFRRTAHYYQLILDSLLEDGLVVEAHTSYRITAKALSAFDSFEAEERRIKSANRLQVILAGLALISAIAACVQACSRRNSVGDRFSCRDFSDEQLVGNLEIHPALCLAAKVALQTQRSIRADSSFAFGNVSQARIRRMKCHRYGPHNQSSGLNVILK